MAFGRLKMQGMKLQDYISMLCNDFYCVFFLLVQRNRVLLLTKDICRVVFNLLAFDDKMLWLAKTPS